MAMKIGLSPEEIKQIRAENAKLKRLLDKERRKKIGPVKQQPEEKKRKGVDSRVLANEMLCKAHSDYTTGSMDKTTSEDYHVMGCLATPRRSGRKGKLVYVQGWNMISVTVNDTRISFYDSETDQANFAPSLILYINKITHVGPVCQKDAYSVDTRNMSRIFQIKYELDEDHDQDDEEVIPFNGHDFIVKRFRIPKSCVSCYRPLWDMAHPPHALECKKCHLIVHKDHFDNDEKFVAMCKVTSITQTREIILLAETSDEQKRWVQHLCKKINKKVKSCNIR